MVTGAVTDTAGTTLACANVVVVGTPRGTMTPRDGRYRISGVVPGYYPVRALMMGYRSIPPSTTSRATRPTARSAVTSSHSRHVRRHQARELARRSSSPEAARPGTSAWASACSRSRVTSSTGTSRWRLCTQRAGAGRRRRHQGSDGVGVPGRGPRGPRGGRRVRRHPGQRGG